MFHIVLYEPEIPPNTGNVMRLAANTGASLHLLHPLGFTMDAKALRRGGLDYRDSAVVREHADFAAFMDSVQPERVFALSSKVSRPLHEQRFKPGDAFLFGPETRGLPAEILAHPAIAQCLKIPMKPGNRSLNLGNAVAVTVYEAWRQNGFA
ncbi:tRNA (cytidine/uridine-2'-O-)-methyltransferase [Natronospira proteinivora]|uniref:tRNA (cytidine(34)-2'-O)-methyltransferase n=1 Tax=Natronospira proteinivora TaxID=1807133 RepID=A0ABT1GA13_9GAMM|nr:tRNA (cytidine(34)-2'-O)-methyltransferase [Natronospira proteinivora]MCP1728101.1 tRNA (cytidine/uridine-2'-O-)-methyltransferase [Natronospira proteinivora]